MIDPNEWRKIPLGDRMASLADHADNALLRETLNEAIYALADVGHSLSRLHAQVADLQAEISRLERLATAVTPY